MTNKKEVHDQEKDLRVMASDSHTKKTQSSQAQEWIEQTTAARNNNRLFTLGLRKLYNNKSQCEVNQLVSSDKQNILDEVL